MKTSRDDVVERSFPLFLKKGFDGATMAELVQASGLSKGAFYYYFEDKASLYEACIDRFFDSFLPDPAASPASAGAFVRALAASYAEALRAAAAACGDPSAYLRFVLSAPEARRGQFAALVSDGRARLAGLLEREGFARREADSEAQRLLALVEGAGVLAAVSGDGAPEGRIRDIVEGYLSRLGLRA